MNIESNSNPAIQPIPAHPQLGRLKDLIKQNCPAFKDGCKYANVSESLSKDVEKCPVFTGNLVFIFSFVHLTQTQHQQ